MNFLDMAFEGDGGENFYVPSPDRIDPTKGYVPGNVRFCSWGGNRMKGQHSAEAAQEYYKKARIIQVNKRA